MTATCRRFASSPGCPVQSSELPFSCGIRPTEGDPQQLDKELVAMTATDDVVVNLSRSS